MSANNVLQAALAYQAAGLSVIPVGGDKKPLCAWKAFQERAAGDKLIWAWFAGRDRLNLGVVCGQVSGGLLVLDFDYEARNTYRRWKESAGGLAEKLPVVRTGKGVHVYLRAADPGGNRRLALNAAGRVLVETRGEGGYVIAPPSRHSSGRHYRWLQGDHQVPQISAGALEKVLAAATALNERGASEDEIAGPGGSTNGETGAEDRRLQYYALAVLSREAAGLAAAPAGSRNQRLNQAAFKAGRYAGAGLLSLALIEGMLLAACAAGGNHLIPDDGSAAFEATLRSGLQAGLARAIDPAALLARLNGHADP